MAIIPRAAIRVTGGGYTARRVAEVRREGWGGACCNALLPIIDALLDHAARAGSTRAVSASRSSVRMGIALVGALVCKGWRVRRCRGVWCELDG